MHRSCIHLRSAGSAAIFLVVLLGTASVSQAQEVAAIPASAPAPGTKASAAAPAAADSPVGGTGFITVQGNKFVDANCKEFLFVGGNSWLTLEAAAGNEKPSSTEYLGGRNLTQYLFDSAKASNITVMRTLMGSADDSTGFLLQTAPGVYNEEAFRALDQIIEDASRSGVKLILAFTDNWHLQDGLFQYVAWANSTQTGDFFTDPAVIQLFKNHITNVVNRTNTLNSRQYKDEPAIFAWDLINELRDGCNTSAPNATCDPSFTASVQTWIEDLSAFVKEQDPNHLVTVGEEGFYGPGSPDLDKNPSPGEGQWCSLTGQNFTQNHAPDSIDFAAVHIWPDLWTIKDPVTFIGSWLTSHIDNARSLGKPFIVEEFGKSLSKRDPGTIAEVRNPIFKVVYDQLSDSLDSDGYFKGAAFWQYSYIAGKTDENAVFFNESTWTDIIKPAADKAVQAVQSRPALANCVPGPLRSTIGGPASATAGRR
ncbi:hypothetical protein ABBQ38_007197 [Trebouxia sp. C0009 RCD-2024]